MYSNLSQQANIYADNVRNEVVSATIGTNEYICHTENYIRKYAEFYSGDWSYPFNSCHTFMNRIMKYCCLER